MTIMWTKWSMIILLLCSVFFVVVFLEHWRLNNWLKAREGREEEREKKLVWAYGLEAGKSYISWLYFVMITCCFRHDEKARRWTEHAERKIHRLNSPEKGPNLLRVPSSWFKHLLLGSICFLQLVKELRLQYLDFWRKH